MKKNKKFLSLLLTMSLVISSFTGFTAQAAEEERNLALNMATEASSVANDRGPELAVNGVTDQAEQWNSADMKSGKIADDAEQTPQWLMVDLGASGSEISKIKLYFNGQVWPMVYRIETTDTPDVATSWETVVSVSRPSASGFVNDTTSGNNIADTNANTDTITLTSKPKIEKTTIKQYVRLYVEKVNAVAPGNNVNLKEIEIYGTNDYKPTYNIIGSVHENVISNEGVESQWNIGEREVTVLTLQENGSKANTTVVVDDHSANYPKEWFPTVSNPNAKPEVIPTIQEWYGYEGNFVLTEESKIVLNDAAEVGLDKAAELFKADVLEITGMDLEVAEGKEGGANDIYIESLTDADAYDLGEEGYLMVTNEDGIKIYAPTYEGCNFGAVTVEQILWMAEDHASVPMGIMRDYPSYEVRGLKLDIARTPYRYQQLVDIVKMMRWYKMSEFGLHINDNDNCNIYGATFDSHAGFHRLESERFPSLISETKHVGIPAADVNEEYYNNNADYQGNPTYSKTQWRDLQAMAEEYGLYVLTEIDLPGHSLLYNEYAAENPDNIDWLEGGIMLEENHVDTQGELELLDLTGANKDRALRFAKELWDEYTEGDEPTIYGDVVHIGADEYWVHNDEVHDAFARFADEMRKVIQGNLGEDTKIRMWGAGTKSFATATKVLGMTSEELASHYQLDIWFPGYDNAAQRIAEGYDVVNCRDAFMYGNPGRSNRDVPNAEYLFNDWNPTIFGGGNPLLGEPHLIGAKAVIWGDQSQEGMTEKDVHQRVLQAIYILSEKTWNGTDEEDTFAEFEIRASRLAEGPGTQIAMEVESASSLVLDYNFENISEDGKTLFDASGNGYDAAVTGGSVEDGWMTFDGETLIETPVQTLSYPYTVSFDLKLDAEDGKANTKESSLFSGYDGRIQVAGKDGKLSADVNYFTRNFNYAVPTNEKEVNVTLVGTFQGTKLYVDGKLVTFLSQKADADGLGGGVQSLYASVLLPLEKIGQDFNGKMANVKVYNKAFSAEEIADKYIGEDDNKVNVAQDTHAGSYSYRKNDAYDNAEQRTRVAMKAIDGDAFAAGTNAAAEPNAASSDIYSYWKGDHADSALTIFLGEARTISEVQIQWRSGGKGRDMQILTSMDGEEWTVAKDVKGNTDFFQTISFTPVEAKYVKFQGVASNGNGYMIQEFLAYEKVDKTELNEVLKAAEAVVKELELGFESEGEEKAYYDAVVLARALVNNELAAQSEIDAAAAALADAKVPDGTPDPTPTPTPTPDPWVNPFKDVAEGKWYYDAVAWGAQNDVVTGLTKDTFGVGVDCTRGQIVTFIWRAMGEPEATEKTHNFTDVEEGKYYYDAMLWAVEEGIVTGLTDTTFGPKDICTRGQMATLLYRLAGEPAVGTEIPFPDVKPDKWYTNATIWASENGIVTGYTDGTFGYNDVVSREQTITMLYRYFVK